MTLSTFPEIDTPARPTDLLELPDDCWPEPSAEEFDAAYADWAAEQEAKILSDMETEAAVTAWFNNL